jgi:hypothetical protein
MIRLKDLLNEIQSKDTYYLNNKIIQVRKEVDVFFKKNKEVLLGYAKEYDWDRFYKMAYDALPDLGQDQVAQELNSILLSLPVDIKLPKKLDQNSHVLEINALVSKWVEKNKNKLIKLADDNKYNEFYDLARKEFPNVQEDKLFYAVDLASIEHNIHYEFITD